MKLPSVTPLEENFLCRKREEFERLVRRTLGKGSGAFFKVFGKSSGKPYYITVLMDNEKILAAEAEDVGGGSSLRGEAALGILKEILDGGPVIVDAFPMTDVEIKMSIVENLEVYNSTPKMKLTDICPSLGGETGETIGESRALQRATSSVTPGITGGITVEERPKKKPKPKTEVVIKAPAEVDSYFRGMVRHLMNIVKGFGTDLKRVEVEAKEVRYALGAGSAIHTNLKLITGGNLPGNVRKELEGFIYREAGEMSNEIGKRIVISRIKFS